MFSLFDSFEAPTTATIAAVTAASATALSFPAATFGWARLSKLSGFGSTLVNQRSSSNYSGSILPWKYHGHRRRNLLQHEQRKLEQ